MDILHSIWTLSREGGGTSAYVAELASEQSRLSKTRVSVLTGVDGGEPVAVNEKVDVLVRERGLMGKAFSRVVEEKAHQGPGQDLIHQHGLWLLSGHQIQKAAERNHVPLLLSSHGMLEPRALRFSKMKKRIALALYQRKDLQNADCLHATALEEAQNLRAFGLKQPIIISPPGVQLPGLSEIRKSCHFAEERKAIFISRIHPIKNLLGLLRVWATIQPEGWKLEIAGPAEGGHDKELEFEIKRLKLSATVRLIGPLYGEAKAEFYRSASLFILPSFSENFGIVVPEALSYNVPVLTSTATPWSELLDKKCGWWVDPNDQSVAEALKAATELSDSALLEMGERGRALVIEKYQWSQIAKQLLDGYQWIIAGGAPPSCLFKG